MQFFMKIIYLSLESKILLTKPISLASSAGNFLHVKANSLTKLRLPTTFGNLCKVPTSAAIPIYKMKPDTVNIRIILNFSL